MRRWISDITVLGLVLGALIVGAAFASALHYASSDVSRASLFRDIVLGFFSSAAGAVGGAYAAQWIADRSALRKSLLQEIRAANTAHNHAAKIFSSAINTYDQFSAPLRESFEIQRQRFVNGQPPPDDNRLWIVSFNPPVLDADVLRKQVLEQLDSGARTQAIAMVLSQSANDLIATLEQRNAWTKEFGKKFPHPTVESMHIYYGVEYTAGILDQTNMHLVQNIFDSTRACIWFSYTLCTLLTEHGKKAIRKWDYEFGADGRPAIRTIALTEETRQKVPNDSEFSTWLASNFPSE